MNDAETARRLRQQENLPFQRLVRLLGGNEVKAVKAMREETEFIAAHPELPTGSQFAADVRGWLIANKLEWTQENLEKATHAVKRS